MANNTHSLSLASASSQYAYRENADCSNLGESGGSDPSLFSAWVLPNAAAHTIICAHTKGFDEYSDMPSGGFEFSIVADGSGGYWPHFVLYQYRGTPPNFNGLQFTANSISLTPGIWTHLAGYLYTTDSGNTSNIRFYINGAFSETISHGNTAGFTGTYSQVTSERFTVGVVKGTDDNFYGYWDGEIDELILTRASDTSNADAIVTAYYRSCNQSATGGLFHFNNALTDASGNGNTLTGVNSPTYAAAAYTCFSPKACMIL